MKRVLLGLLLGLCGVAQAQIATPIQYTTMPSGLEIPLPGWVATVNANFALMGNITPFGVITAGHCVDWVTGTVIGDAGAACGSGGGGSPAWNAVTGGVNAGNTLSVGAGSTLGPVSSGIVNANELNGLALPTSAALLSTNALNQAIALTLGTNLVEVGTVVGTSQTINAQTGTSYTVQITDAGALLTFFNSSAVAVTLPQAGSAGYTAGFSFDLQNKGTGAVTITPQGGSLINGLSTLSVVQNTGCTVSSDGTGYQISACTAAASSGGGSGFGALTGGTNTTATMVVGSGATLAPSGSGTITANVIGGLTATASVAMTGQTANTAVQGLTLANNTAATSGNQQQMCTTLTGQGWSTTSAASQAVNLLLCNQPTQNTTTPGEQFTVSVQLNGGGYTNLLTLDDNVSGTGTELIVNAGLSSGTIQVTGTSCGTSPGIKENTSGVTDLGFCSGAATVGHIGSSGFFEYYPNISASTITQFTIASGTGACATSGTKVGGAIAGNFTCTGSTGASTITLTLPAVTTGYVCTGRDVTTPTTVTQTGAISTTSVTLTMTSVAANDVIQFGCSIAY